MTSPTQFSLANRSLRLDTAEDILPHLSPLHTTRPTSISLNGNTLGVPACAALASALKSHTQLQTANLADIFTSRLLSEIPPALSSLLTALPDLPNLHTIDLSDNAFGLNTVDPLVDFLSKHIPLQHLILQNNGLGPHAGTKIADALTVLAAKKAEARAERGKTVPELETVICGRNRLESGSMAAWAKAYTAHAGGIRTVKMVQNGIRQDGTALLLREGLARCQGLQVLDLQDNTFTITGARALVGVVGQWRHLTELGVGDSLLGSKGALLLAKELAKKEVGGKLEVLRVQYNEIDARGVKALYEAAQQDGLPALKRVELNGNKFSEEDESIEGLRALLDKKKEAAGVEDDGDEWGLDELDELESEDEEEEEEEEDDEEAAVADGQETVREKEESKEADARREVVLKDADEEESQKVSQKKDDDVDALADQLGGTHVK